MYRKTIIEDENNRTTEHLFSWYDILCEAYIVMPFMFIGYIFILIWIFITAPFVAIYAAYDEFNCK